MMQPSLGLAISLVLVCSAHSGEPQVVEERQWILVTTEGFRRTVSPLVQHRKDQGWKTRCVTVTEDPGPRDEDKLLVDSRNTKELKQALSDFITTFPGASSILLVGHWDTGVEAFIGEAGRMKGLWTDHPLGFPDSDGAATVAVGRLPARNAEQVALCVKKIISFESRVFDQNHMSLLVGDPGGRSAMEMSIAQQFIKAAVDKRLELIDGTWEVTCAMDIDGSEYSVRDVEFSDRVTTGLTTDQQFAIYCGHSGPTGPFSRSGELVLKNSLKHVQPEGRTGVLLTTGCYACQVKGSGGQGYGIDLVGLPVGPAAVIGASAESYAAIGQLALDGALRCLSSDSPPRLVGDYWLAVQEGIARGKISPTEFYLYDMADGSGGNVPLAQQRREHLEMWNLLGDPAMAIPFAFAE